MNDLYASVEDAATGNGRVAHSAMAMAAAASLLNCGNFQITYYANNIKAINKLVMLIKAIKLN